MTDTAPVLFFTEEVPTIREWADSEPTCDLRPFSPIGSQVVSGLIPLSAPRICSAERSGKSRGALP
jgi:hypothetical protein